MGSKGGGAGRDIEAEGAQPERAAARRRRLRRSGFTKGLGGIIGTSVEGRRRMRASLAFPRGGRRKKRDAECVPLADEYLRGDYHVPPAPGVVVPVPGGGIVPGAVPGEMSRLGVVVPSNPGSCRGAPVSHAMVKRAAARSPRKRAFLIVFIPLSSFEDRWPFRPFPLFSTDLSCRNGKEGELTLH